MFRAWWRKIRGMNTAIHVQELHNVSSELSANTAKLKTVLRRYSQAPDPLIALIEVFHNQRDMANDDKSHS